MIDLKANVSGATIKASLVLTFLAFMLFSCRKGEGPGGKATITGRIYVEYYNSTGTAILKEFYGADKDVYIIYGDNEIYDDNTATHFDGTFKFDYLRPGNYTIFAYSKDVTGTGPNPDIAVLKEVVISDNKETVDVGDIVIEDN